MGFLPLFFGGGLPFSPRTKGVLTLALTLMVILCCPVNSGTIWELLKADL